MAILGIDLGTSNSVAAVAVAGETYVIQPAEGPTEEGIIFPSYVLFDALGEVESVGLPAKRRYRGEAGSIVRHAKRLIGRSYDYIHQTLEAPRQGSRRRNTLDEFARRLSRGDTGEILINMGTERVRQYTPQDIARILLTKIREDAEQQLRRIHGASIDQVVITVPAGFDDAPLRATRWAGEQVFGAGNVQLIPEPLAAALASGTLQDQEMVMVVDMGAGTTDIVVGNVVRLGRFYEWLPVTQGCDDELGGWDMDYQLLEHLLREDRRAPYLNDLYPLLDLGNQGKLMEAIERAKIAVSVSGSGVISTVLEADIHGERIRKPVMATLDEQILRKVVAYRELSTREDHGSVVMRCRALVERTLLELADGDRSRMAEARASLDRVIMVGGPMRMRCLYDMMCEVFADRPGIMTNFDPLDTFPMECVARGAALYQGERVILQVPHTLSLYNWSQGGAYTPVIPRNTPFDGEAEETVEVDVEPGSTWLDIITEKSNVSLPDYPVREHLVRVPFHGKLNVTLRWDTSGCRIALSGAGLTQLEIPAISEQTTLRESFTRQFATILQTAKQLKSHLADPRLRSRVNDALWQSAKKHAPDEVQLLITVQPEAAQEAWKIGNKTIREVIEQESNTLLDIPAQELSRFEALDLRVAGVLNESELEIMLQKGFNAGAREAAKARGISEQIFTTLRTVRSVQQERTTVMDLQHIGKTLLHVAKKAHFETTLVKELRHMLNELSLNPANSFMMANVSARAAALADILHDKGYISRDAMQRSKTVIARMQVDQN